MNQIMVEDQVSVNEIPDATSGSNEVDSGSNGFEFFLENGLAKIHESTLEDSIIRTSLFSGIDQGLVEKTKIVAIHKNLNSSWSGKARAQSFRLFSKAVADNYGADANIKYAWYGASRDEICEIAMHGFNWCLKVVGNRDCCRHSISLSPAKFSFDR